MKNMKILHRILIIAAIALVGMVAGNVVGMFTLRSSLMQDRQVKTRNLVEAAHALIVHYGEMEQAGALSREDAQAAAKAAVKALRYEQGDYFWINDYDARIIMHPIKPELEGKNLATFEDAEGTRLFSEFASTVKRAGAGFVPYLLGPCPS